MAGASSRSIEAYATFGAHSQVDDSRPGSRFRVNSTLRRDIRQLLLRTTSGSAVAAAGRSCFARGPRLAVPGERDVFSLEVTR
jgi:hypothetical protein